MGSILFQEMKRMFGGYGYIDYINKSMNELIKFLKDADKKQ